MIFVLQFIEFCNCGRTVIDIRFKTKRDFVFVIHLILEIVEIAGNAPDPNATSISAAMLLNIRNNLVPVFHVGRCSSYG